jgi:hypothetical protein
MATTRTSVRELRKSIRNIASTNVIVATIERLRTTLPTPRGRWEDARLIAKSARSTARAESGPRHIDLDGVDEYHASLPRLEARAS